MPFAFYSFIDELFGLEEICADGLNKNAMAQCLFAKATNLSNLNREEGSRKQAHMAYKFAEFSDQRLTERINQFLQTLAK